MLVDVEPRSARPAAVLPSPLGGGAGGRLEPRLGTRLEAVRPVVRAVVSRVLRLPPLHADVDDCVAETFRRLVEGLERLRPGEPLGPWAAGIAHHVSVDLVRARRREQRHVDAAGDEAASVDPTDPSPGPEEDALSAERLALLRRALGTLAEGPREAVIAFHVEGKSYQEIAARLGVPMGTVATWIARSRKTLSEALEAAGLGVATNEGRRR